MRVVDKIIMIKVVLIYFSYFRGVSRYYVKEIYESLRKEVEIFGKIWMGLKVWDFKFFCKFFIGGSSFLFIWGKLLLFVKDFFKSCNWKVVLWVYLYYFFVFDFGKDGYILI